MGKPTETVQPVPPQQPMQSVYPDPPYPPPPAVPGGHVAQSAIITKGYTAQPPMTQTPGIYADSEKESQLSSQIHFHSNLPPLKEGEFSNGFCTVCSSCSTCCLGWWCPCVVYGRTRQRLDNPLMPKEHLSCCSGSCWAFALVMTCCYPCQCFFGCLQRGELRAKYGIKGNVCVDCLAHYFCDCCVSSPCFLDAVANLVRRLWFKKTRKFNKELIELC